MSCKIYGPPKSFRMQKVLIAAAMANKEVTVHDQKPPQNKFPLGVTPALEDENVTLFGADAVGFYLTETLMNDVNYAELLQWMHWAEGQLLPNVLGCVLPSVSAVQVEHKEVEAARTELLMQLKHLDEVLLTKTFLVGERLSLADVSVAMDLLPAYQYVLDEAARTPFINVSRWLKTIINQPPVKKVIGEAEFASEVSKFDMAKFKELSAKFSTDHLGHKEEKNKEPQTKQKKEQHKKDDKAKHAMKQADDEEDFVDELLSQEPKATDPFASMPKGTFVMDAFKRVYSNEDTATKAIPYFWENFDPENYSIWYGEYKYPEDLTLTFMSCNLISGMFQRLEKLKKHAFASVCLFGTDNNSTISGIWIWRGHELAFLLSPDWQVDYESYAWEKLDPSDEKTKKLVNEYLMWEGDFGGKKFNQGKIFK